MVMHPNYSCVSRNRLIRLGKLEEMLHIMLGNDLILWKPFLGENPSIDRLNQVHTQTQTHMSCRSHNPHRHNKQTHTHTNQAQSTKLKHQQPSTRQQATSNTQQAHSHTHTHTYTYARARPTYWQVADAEQRIQLLTTRSQRIRGRTKEVDDAKEGVVAVCSAYAEQESTAENIQDQVKRERDKGEG